VSQAVSRFALALLLAAVLASPGRDAIAGVGDDDDFAAKWDPPVLQGPLGVRTQGTLRELFLDPIILDARPIDRFQLDLRWAVANAWSIPTSFTQGAQTSQIWTDEQADSLTVRVGIPWSKVLGPGRRDLLPGSARPLWARLSTSFEWRITEHWGGWSDAPIGGFHALIGGFDYERNRYPNNQTRLFLGDQDGLSAFDLHQSILAMGDLVARNQFLLAETGQVFVAARFDLKAPTGRLSRAGGSGGWDAALGIAGTFLLSPAWTLHAMATLSVLSQLSAPIELQPKTWHGTFEVSFEWNLGPVELLFEDRLLSPLLIDGWTRLEFGGGDGFISSAYAASFRAHNQLSAGVRWRELSFWLSEDYTPGSNPRSVITWVYVSNSPDIVAGLSWTKNF
jgi:hypothetical protein